MTHGKQHAHTLFTRGEQSIALHILIVFCVVFSWNLFDSFEFLSDSRTWWEKDIFFFFSLPLGNANRTKGTKTYANGDTVLTDDTTTDIPMCVCSRVRERRGTRYWCLGCFIHSQHAFKHVFVHTICGEVFLLGLVCGRDHTRNVWMCA